MKYICEFFSASDRTDGGIYRMALTDTLDFIRISKIDLPKVQWIELDGDRLCAAYRDKQNGDGYVEFSLDGKRLGDIIRTRGENVCHFCRDGSDVYFANYDDGCVSKSGGKAFIQSGETGPMKARQMTAHAHECIFSPDKRYVLACDLGLDAVIVYDRELNEISRAKVLPGQGVRHAVFSKDGTKLYAITELGSTIASFSWNDGRLTYEKTYNMLQSSGRGDGAEIVLSDDGRHLYATNRANREFGTDNLICHFTVGEELSLVSRCFVSRRSSASLCAHLRWKICVVVEHFRQFSKPVQDKGRRRAMVHQNRAFPDAHVHKRNFIMRCLRSLFGAFSESNKKRSLHRIGNSADFLLRITFLRLHPRR